VRKLWAGLNLPVFFVPLEEAMEHPGTAPSKTQQTKRAPVAHFGFSETALLFFGNANAGAVSAPSETKQNKMGDTNSFRKGHSSPMID
jgi:hypothetical protein